MTKTTTPMLPLDPAQPIYGYRPAHFNTAPAVSVVTPYFNTGPLFLETARSLLRQSLQNWEWIIINDGSTEAGALRALLPFRAADPRMRVIDQPNRGLPAARNAAVRHASAPFLFFLDSDDLLQPTALEKLAWALVSRPESAFVTSWQRSFGAKNFLWPRGFETRYAFLYEDMTAPTVMMRRSVFDAVGGFDEARRQGLEDYEFWLRCAAHGVWGHDIHEYLLAIRAKTPEQYRGYQWLARDAEGGMAAFRADMRRRYPQLFRNGLPTPERASNGMFDTYSPIPSELPFANRLEVHGQRRVLLLLPWMRFGGADRWALDVVRGFSQRGDRVSVALTRDDMPHDWLGELVRETSDVFDLGAFLEQADFPRFLHYLLESRSITHVVVSNSLLGYRLLPYLRARCPDVAMLDFQHMEETWRAGGFPRTSIEYAELLDLQMANSAHLRRWMLDRGAKPDRVEICTVNTDTTWWQHSPEQRRAARAALGIPTEAPVVAMVARLVPQKRPRLAAEIFRQLRERNTPFLALVVGDGEDMGWMRRFVRRHKLGDRVRLLGARDAAGVRDVLASADALLLPSENEALALVVQEAMAMGVVPVAAAVGGMRELVTPETGILIPHGPGEAERYAEALGSLLADEGRRKAMACAARERMVSHFDLETMLDRLQELLDRATANHHSAPRQPVSSGIGLAAASLAIEHEQIERRLRGFLPIRLLLAARRSSAWRAMPRLNGVRAAIERFDRAVYRARRTVMQRVRRR